VTQTNPFVSRRSVPPQNLASFGDFSGLRSAMESLLTCVGEALPDPAPARMFLYAGEEPPWDDCCDGQVWVRLVSVTPAGTNPTRGGCGPAMWAASVRVGVLRCAATLGANGTLPAVADMIRDTAVQIADMAAVESAIKCCFESKPLEFVSWVPLGVEGGCAGGEWSIILKLNSCGC
jgi:hypothetical protein